VLTHGQWLTLIDTLMQTQRSAAVAATTKNKQQTPLSLSYNIIL
jgi:hypothetical protein